MSSTTKKVIVIGAGFAGLSAASFLAQKGWNVTIIEKHDLPELFRTPFNLYVEGYKYNEIAEALNEPLGTIKSRIHFARKILKQKIQRY